MSRFVWYVLLILIITQPLSVMAVDNQQSRNTGADSTHVVKGIVTPRMKKANTSVNPITGNVSAINPTQSFSHLPGCPGDPSRVNIPGSTWPTEAACPNINGVWPSIVSNDFQATIRDPLTNAQVNVREAYCPSSCTVSRYVVGGIGSPTDIKEAVCPVGYLATSTYNAQPEILPTSQATNIPAPIYWTDYVQYVSQGYECTAQLIAQTTANQINTCVTSDSPAYQIYAGRVTVGALGASDAVGSPVENGGYAGQYTPMSSDSGSCFKYDPDNLTCTTPVGAVMTHPGQTDCEPTVDGEPAYYAVKINYGFYYFSCTLPANSLVQTGENAPSSVVCSRISLEWNSP